MKNLHLALIIFTTFSLQLLTHKAQAQVSFSPVTTFSVNTSPISIAKSDFNGDGYIDLAVANSGSNNVSVLLGNGTGGFGTAASFAVGNNPRSVTNGDFNMDGNIDLATANQNSGNVSVLFGNGSGAFNNAINFSLALVVVDSSGTHTISNNPLSVASADFNGDGKLDLASANGGDNVSILLGNGLGSFSAVTMFTTGSYPVSIISADFNGDGEADLVTVNQSSNNVSLLLGNGLGSFSSPTNFAVGSTPCSAVSSDFNEDGKADLGIAVNGGNKITVLLGNGAGSFGTASYFLAGSGPFSITSNDFNADGKTDLAAANINDNNVSILLGNGAGSFGIATNFAVGAQSISVLDGDFNGDGKIDLAVADQNDNDVSVLINITSPSAPPICLVTVDSTQTHNLVVWEKTNMSTTAIDSFIVYREITTNNYQRIGAVFKDSLSTFDDFGSNPESTGYRYKLKSKNAQGEVSLFSDYHNTIYLTNTGANFSWTPYQ